MYVFEQVNLYILVAGLEALCVCSATKSSNGVIYRFSQESQYCTGYPQIQVQIESELKVTIRTGWSPKVVC